MKTKPQNNDLGGLTPLHYNLVIIRGRKVIIPTSSEGGGRWEKYGVKKIKQRKSKGFAIPLETVEPLGGKKACKIKNMKNKICPATCSSWVSTL